MNEELKSLNDLPSINDIIKFIDFHNLNEIIDYLHSLVNNLYNEEINTLTLKHNIIELIKICNDIKIYNNLDYKIILINNINYIFDNYDKTNFDISINENNIKYTNNNMIINITNDILLYYKNNIYVIKNENIKLDNINININLLNYNRNIIKIIFNKDLTINNLNITLINNNDKNISIQFNGINKNKIIINQLNINGCFNTLFMNTISINFQIHHINILNNYSLYLLSLNHVLLNNGKINFININKSRNFKIIFTNYKLLSYTIFINNEPYVINHLPYKSFINNIDFYL